MKRIIWLLIVSIAAVLNASAQHAIRADRVRFHIGEDVVVVDSITSVTVQNDSTTIIGMGQANKGLAFTVILKLSPGHNLDSEFLNSLTNSLLEVKGHLEASTAGASMTVRNKDSLFFFSPVIKQRWAVLSERTGSKIE